MVAQLIHNNRLYSFLSGTNVDKNIKGHFVFTAGKVYQFDERFMEGKAMMLLQQKMLMEGLNLTFIINEN